MITNHRCFWYHTALFLLLLTGSAAAVVVRDQRLALPDLLRHPLDTFISPGVTLWWMTHGAVFRSFPDPGPDYLFVAVANALLWLVIVMATSWAFTCWRRAAKSGSRVKE